MPDWPISLPSQQNKVTNSVLLGLTQAVIAICGYEIAMWHGHPPSVMEQPQGKLLCTQRLPKSLDEHKGNP